tara:strand:+ start:48 stop:1514 length:1467 start_codon:yes stop_codon:yes gene_type:complete
MKKIITIIASLTLTLSSFAQLPNGSVAPDFTLTDINGDTHTLYDYLGDGYTVFLDFSAVWCGPCWSYHASGALEDLYIDHGPAGMPNVSATTTDDVMVFFIEGDASALSCLQGTGCGTQGDWVSGTPYPIICTDGQTSSGGNNTSVVSAYSIGYWPTVYQVCPDRLLTECGQTATPYALVGACLPPPAFDVDARSFLKNSANTGCTDISPEIYLQNYGFTNLTEVTIDVSVNGSLQYTTTYNTTSTWNGTSYDPLNLSTLEIDNVVLDPVLGLSNGDLIEIDVSLPNGQSDSDPTNNQTISMIVDLGFDNTYWDAPLSIDVSGNNGNAWFLKKVSNGLIIGSGYGGVVGASNNIFPLEFEECYTLQSVANDVGNIGSSYTITDGNGQVVLQGTTSQLEEFDNFSTGAELWTDLEDVSNTISVYPVPASEKLYIEGEYDYIKIIDLLGKEVLQSENVKSVDISHLNCGVYLLEIISSDKKYSQKIQIAR